MADSPRFIRLARTPRAAAARPEPSMKRHMSITIPMYRPAEATGVQVKVLFLKALEAEGCSLTTSPSRETTDGSRR
jgi:hypothetical protein